MIKNNFWESIVWIIIWVFILSFIILWVTNLIINSKTSINEYKNIKIINTLKISTNNILKKIDLSTVTEDDIIYIYKNNTSHTFEIFTWAINQQYKYIDEYWNKIDNISSYLWNVYERYSWIDRQDTLVGELNKVIKTDIKKYIPN